jgi:hypothetical protein
LQEYFLLIDMQACTSLACLPALLDVVKYKQASTEFGAWLLAVDLLACLP